VTGAKPPAVCRWIFTLLGAGPQDTLDDLFPGFGAVSRAWAAFTRTPAAVASRAARDASSPARADTSAPVPHDVSLPATRDASAVVLRDS
jgi:hypothetical protein